MNWTRVDERNPEDCDTVLAYWEKTQDVRASYESLTYYAADGPDGPSRWIDVFGNKSDEPTHWMPLPEPPK